MKDGEAVEATICQYVDWLLSTYNPNNPEENNWIKPVIHPCQKKHVDANMTDTDYEDLLNTVQTYSLQFCILFEKKTE